MFLRHRLIGLCRFPSLHAALLLGLILTAPIVRADSFDCQNNRCGLLTDGAYRNYVIGTLTRIADRDDMRRVYRWARHHGYWRSLPSHFAPYDNDIVMVSITPSRQTGIEPVTVFMQRSEYESAPYNIGDLVRYTPHTSDMEAPKGDPVGMKLFRGLTGCVATLCANTDQSCMSRYRMGLYTKKEGRPLSFKNREIMEGKTGIDPVSLLPEK